MPFPLVRGDELLAGDRVVEGRPELRLRGACPWAPHGQAGPCARAGERVRWAEDMAHFWGPSDSQLVPDDVFFYDVVGGAPNEVSGVDIPIGAATVPVNLWGATGFKVESSDETVIADPIPESSNGESRVLRLKGVTTGTTIISVTGSDGRKWIFLKVTVYKPDPTVAARQSTPQGSAPQAGGGSSSPEPVAELLGIVEDAGFKVGGRVSFLKDDAVRNLLKVFLYSHRALAGRKMPVKNAVLVAAHTGAETLFGTSGPNAAIGNWFSLQLDNADKRKRVKDALVARGVPMDNSPRGNRASAGAAVTGSAVDNPIFKTTKGGKDDFDVPGMLDAQFDLVYGAPKDAGNPSWAPDPNALFTSIGRALTRSDATASSLGTVIGGAYAGVGTPEGAAYSTRLAGNYDHVMRALKWFVGTLPAIASAGTQTWASTTLRGVAGR
jgi:hypothetical protein